MPSVPQQFYDEFEQKGDNFFNTAELLYRNPGRQYTQGELAEEFGISTTRISKYTQAMEESHWINRKDNQTTYSWNTEIHNPSETEGLTALKLFYTDFWKLLSRHTKTLPGGLAVAGFSLILVGLVLFIFFIGFSLGITRESPIPTIEFFLLGISAFISGVIVSAISPLQAFVNKVFSWILTKL